MDTKTWNTVYSNRLHQVQIKMASKEDSEKVLSGIYGVGYVPNKILKEFNISMV